jgi:hypothetical protein
MDWQQLVSLTIVAVAASLLLAGVLRRRKFDFTRKGHCGCGTVFPEERRKSVVFRARKGRRPEVIVKM